MKNILKISKYLSIITLLFVGSLIVTPQTADAVAITATCAVSATAVDDVDDKVTYTANYTGGVGGYTFNWSGPFTSSSQVVQHEFVANGSFVAILTVTDSSGNTDSDVCPTVVVWDMNIDDDDDNDDDNDNDDDDLQVICRVSDTSIDEGDSVEFEADVDGGDSPFEYDWDGDIGGDGRTETKVFNDNGNYNVEITVTDDDGNTASDDCPTIRVSNEDNDDDNDNDDLEVQCKVSDTSIKVGDRVEFEAEVDGGNSPFEYDWSGSFSGDERTETVRFNEEGTFSTKITVEDDDGEEDSDNCPSIKVTDDDEDEDEDDDNDDDNDITVTVTTYGGSDTYTGELASLNSVFLSQIPSTGTGDIVLTILYTILLLLISASIVYYHRNKQVKKLQSQAILDFKQRNRLG